LREYRHLAQIQHHANWFENFKKRNADYKTLIEDTPSLKTSSSRLLLRLYVNM
jgi:hypothetical protein